MKIKLALAAAALSLAACNPSEPAKAPATKPAPQAKAS